MAGTDSRFNATKFRDGIRFAMQMGFPEDEQKGLAWRWTTKRTFTTTDSGDLPLVWDDTQVVQSTAPSDMIVDCAVAFAQGGGQARVGGTSLGVMDIAQVTVTLLDTDYDALMAHGSNVFPDKAVIDGNVYIVQYVAPPIGLFEVTVYQVALGAIDET